MTDGAATALPAIEDAAILRVCGALGLPPTAFSGADGQDPRLSVLKSLESLDIEACPGSGKTTLLVAKLAILGGLWAERRRGLCVLSHTNVARREIERTLGCTADGQGLLAYPHFVGTIHAFVNEFLALPWVRSKGYPVEQIDNEVAQQRRWRRLHPATRSVLERNRHDASVLKIRDSAFTVGNIRWGRGGLLARDTPTYQALVNACRQTTQEGYFCHDEMFVWAHDLLDQLPEVACILRARFPLVLLDEVQDNSEMQAALLHRLFMSGEFPVIRQRYGDANQAIFQYAGQTEGAATDLFPVTAIRADLPNSLRFDQTIADLANPLAPEPQGLQGKREPVGGEADRGYAGKHAIFLFDDLSIDKVLENYGAYLLDIFSAEERQIGTFTAIGAVHRPSTDTDLPRHVGHYWSDYDHSIARADPQPETFVRYVSAGHRMSIDSGEAHAAVEKIAEAVLRLIRISAPSFPVGSARRKHRQLLALLDGDDAAGTAYGEMVRSLAVERLGLSAEGWTSRWKPAATRIAHAITGVEPDGDDVAAFLAWDDTPPQVAGHARQVQAANSFRYPPESPSVAIRVGSIHAAKGQTHTATLVLETFYYAHHLKTLKPWLLGDRAGGAGENARLQSRLKLHYVAMTRPSRLLCLALREDALNPGDIEMLKRQGWRVARVTSRYPEWMREKP